MSSPFSHSFRRNILWPCWMRVCWERNAVFSKINAIIWILGASQMPSIACSEKKKKKHWKMMHSYDRHSMLMKANESICWVSCFITGWCNTPRGTYYLPFCMYKLTGVHDWLTVIDRRNMFNAWPHPCCNRMKQQCDLLMQKAKRLAFWRKQKNGLRSENYPSLKKNLAIQ